MGRTEQALIRLAAAAQLVLQSQRLGQLRRAVALIVALDALRNAQAEAAGVVTDILAGTARGGDVPAASCGTEVRAG